ncbi:MAG: hypothetical protein B7X06_02775, partial [Verrucomicrobia bacterium 21-51-4]
MALELNYVLYGSLERPCIVILHGLLGSSRNWATIARALTEGSCVFCVDLRNHGHSPHAEPSDYAAMMEDVVHFIKTQCPSKPVLMGHSLGGKVSMALACKHPELIEKLVVVDIAPKAYPMMHSRKEFEGLNAIRLTDHFTRQDVEQKLAQWVSDWGTRQFLMTNLVHDESVRGFKWQVNLPALTAYLPQFSLNPLEPSDRYLGPTLFI